MTVAIPKSLVGIRSPRQDYIDGCLTLTFGRPQYRCSIPRESTAQYSGATLLHARETDCSA